MADFIMIIPTRGRPGAVRELAEAFSAACTADTHLVIAVDDDDPELGAYTDAVKESREIFPNIVPLVQHAPGNMATALNMAAEWVCAAYPDAKAIGFMGDDHRPRTVSWDSRYLEVLIGTPGVVYGNDLIHGVNLPTQFAVSASIVQALGFMAPKGLRHMYIDNYWRDIGRMSKGLTYASDVVVEHMHPVASKSEYDEGYERVNAPEVFAHDAKVYELYMKEQSDADVATIMNAVGR